MLHKPSSCLNCDLGSSWYKVLWDGLRRLAAYSEATGQNEAFTLCISRNERPGDSSFSSFFPLPDSTDFLTLPGERGGERPSHSVPSDTGATGYAFIGPGRFMKSVNLPLRRSRSRFEDTVDWYARSLSLMLSGYPNMTVRATPDSRLQRASSAQTSMQRSSSSDVSLEPAFSLSRMTVLAIFIQALRASKTRSQPLGKHDRQVCMAASR